MSRFRRGDIEGDVTGSLLISGDEMLEDRKFVDKSLGEYTEAVRAFFACGHNEDFQLRVFEQEPAHEG